MPLSLTFKIEDQGDGTSQVTIRVNGENAIGLVNNAELYQTNTIFFEQLGRGLQPSPAVRRAAVNRQERRCAEELGGHRQTGSGAVRGIKGDGRVFGKYRIENKSTTSKSFDLKLSDLQKIRSHCAGLEVPIFEVEFQEKITFRPIEKWALVPWDEWVRRTRESDVGNDR